MSDITTSSVPSGDTTIVTPPTLNLVDKTTLEAMLRLLLTEVKAVTLETTSEWPEDITANETKVTTLKAVNERILDIVGKRIMFLDTNDTKDDFLTLYENNLSLDEITDHCLFVFKNDPEKPNLRELWINNTKEGETGFIKLGATNLDDLGLNMDEYWSKDEFDPSLYETIADLTTKLADYVRIEDIVTITEDEVTTMFNEIKAELAATT